MLVQAERKAALACKAAFATKRDAEAKMGAHQLVLTAFSNVVVQSVVQASAQVWLHFFGMSFVPRYLSR